jgi:hypothetical protein
MKKGSYWFGFLSAKEQEEFKHNFFNRIEEVQEFKVIGSPITTFETFCLELEFDSFRQYILFPFMWNVTPQGFEYWCKISYRKTDEVIK